MVPLKPLDEIFTPADRAFTVMGGSRPVVGIFQVRADTPQMDCRTAVEADETCISGDSESRVREAHTLHLLSTFVT